MLSYIFIKGINVFKEPSLLNEQTEHCFNHITDQILRFLPFVTDTFAQ